MDCKLNNEEAFFSVQGRSSLPFQWFVGPRGVGKTYSALALCLGIPIPKNSDVEKYHKSDKKFIYLRYSEADLEKCAGAVGNPFKKLNTDYDRNISLEYNKKKGYAEIMEQTESGETIIGYGMALTVFAGLRGIDLSDVDIVVFDEAILELHKAKRKHMGDALLNLYETINRNRELFGEPPLFMLFMANSITMDSELLAATEAVPLMQQMFNTGHTRASDREKGIYVEFALAKVSEMKRNTALYRLKKGSDFAAHAIDNAFTNDKINLVKKVQLMEYVPKVRFCDVYIYEHKSKPLLYACKVKASCKDEYEKSDKDAFKFNYRLRYMMAVNLGVIGFDSYETKLFIDAAIA